MAYIVFALVLALFPCSLHGTGDVPASDWLSRELYCHGCQYTLKAFEKLMEEEPLIENENLDERISRLLGDVCNEEMFKGLDDQEKIVEACSFMIGENEKVLELLLGQYHSRKVEASYYDLFNQVCMGVTNACKDVSGENVFPDQLDSDLVFDKEDNTFRVKPDREIKIPQPVRAKDDL